MTVTEQFERINKIVTELTGFYRPISYQKASEIVEMSHEVTDGRFFLSNPLYVELVTLNDETQAVIHIAFMPEAMTHEDIEDAYREDVFLVGYHYNDAAQAVEVYKALFVALVD